MINIIRINFLGVGVDMNIDLFLFQIGATTIKGKTHLKMTAVAFNFLFRKYDRNSKYIIVYIHK